MSSVRPSLSAFLPSLSLLRSSDYGNDDDRRVKRAGRPWEKKKRREERRGDVDGGRDRRRERTRDIDEAESGMEKKDAAKEGLKVTERGTREWAAGSWAALQHFLIASMMLGGRRSVPALENSLVKTM